MEKPATAKAYTVPWKIADLLVVGVSVMALILAFNVLLFFLDSEPVGDGDSRRSFFTLGLFLIQSGIFYLPLHYGILKKYGLTLRELGLRWIGFGRSLLWALKGFGVVIVINFLLSVVIDRVGELPGFGQQEEYVELFGSGVFDMLIALLVLAIIAPIVEEIFFRGFLLQTLLSRMSVPAASVLTAGVFSLAHLQPESSGIIFILCLVLNWLFIRTGSIVPSIIFHMLNNALAFAMEFVW